MKVLTICDVLFPHTVGGAGRFAREVAESLLRQGLEVEFLTRRVQSRLEETIHSEYLPPVWQVPSGAFQRALERQIQRFEPDVIHSHQPLPAYLTSAWSKSVPLVHTFHSSWPEEFKVKSSRWPGAFRAPIAGLYAQFERRVIPNISPRFVIV